MPEATNLPANSSALESPTSPPARLVSLDAYRGFIMLAMASSGFGFAAVAKKDEVLNRFADSSWNGAWQAMWRTLAYQFDHVAWTGCGFWDLIQPSFMFMVGVALPFSNSRRQQDGQSDTWRWMHVLWRSLALIMLGIFLSSNGSPLTNFTFVNVLTQIGLGYPFLFLLNRFSPKVQLATAGLILLGYWTWFAGFTTPTDNFSQLTQAITETKKKDTAEWSQFSGFASHWNKHINAAASVDRWFLNLFPRDGEPWEGKKFWINDGGYQTLNFLPSLATMIFGLLAGNVLRDERTPHEKLRWLLIAGAICLFAVLPFDTTIWPVQFASCSWTICPCVKRIWTPTWAIFSTGWTYWMLATFYWLIDIRGWRRWAWPFVVVGMNSIAMYCLAQLLKPWLRSSVKTHSATLDALLGWEEGLNFHLFSDQSAFAPIWINSVLLFLLWLICLWLYRRRIFLRI